MRVILSSIARAESRPPATAGGSDLASESEPQRELDGAGAADLKGRAQAAVDAARAEAARERLHALPEEAVGQVAHGVAEVRVVEDVENFGAHLQPRRLAEGELAAHCEVELREPEAAQGVAPERALPADDRTKRSGVEPASARGLRVCDVDGHAFEEVGPERFDEVAGEDAGRPDDVDGRGRARAEDGVERPAAQEGPGRSLLLRARKVVAERAAQ